MFTQEIPLPERWEDERIRSSASLLGLGVNVLIDPTSFDEAMERLASVREELGLDPDQLHRALAEHEPFLAFQDADQILLEGAVFRVLAPWDPRKEEI